jgi:holin-like protein
MINSLIKLLLFQAMGEIGVFVLSIPIPGPVVGMLLLFLYLAFRAREDDGLTVFSARFLSHLPLLFIPAAVGITLHLDRVAAEWLPILIALSGSNVVSVVVAAVVVRRLKKY